jgi:hypothetical protein
MTTEYTLQQKQALAMASARKRKADAEKTASLQEPNVLQNLSERGQEANKLKQMRQAGQITRPEEIIRSAGQGAGAIMDVSGAAVGAVDDLLLNAPSKALGYAASTVGSLPIPFDKRNLGEFVGGAVGSGMQQYSEFKKENPRKAGLLEAAGNIASVASAPFTKQPIKNVGQNIIESGIKKSDNSILKTIQPAQTTLERTAAQKQGRLIPGLSDAVSASDIEKRAIDVIKRDNVFGKILPKSLSKKETLARQRAIGISQELQQELGKYNNVKFKPDPLKKTLLNKIEQDLTDDPTIWTSTGDPKTLVQNYIQKANEIIDSNPKTLQGLMKSRIDFDKWVQSKTPNVFNPGAETVNRAATKAVRNSINDFIDKSIPNDAVKQRLSDSSALFTAADNMADKVGRQAPTALGRAVQSLEDKLPFRSELAKLGFIAGVGAAGYAIPQIATAGGALYLGGKALTSAQSKKFVGAVLKQGAGVIDQATKNELQDYLTELQNQEDDELKQPAKDVINKQKGNQ